MARTARPAHVVETTSEIDVHRGEVFLKLANTYKDLMGTLNECIQNGIDADARRVLIGIDLKKRTVIVTDNGSGIDQQRFKTALESIGHSIKDKDRLGRFGLGLISPLNKCNRFLIISRPPGYTRALQWTFVKDDIVVQHRSMTIPLHTLPDGLPNMPPWLNEQATGEFSADWRTQVVLQSVTKDKVISLVDLDEMESNVRQKFSRPMRQRSILVRVVLIDETGRKQVRDISPVDYSGEPLPDVVYHDPVAGEVTIKLYRATKRMGVRSGQVVIAETDGSTPISMTEFTRQARGGEWFIVADAAFSALSSGYFEGTVSCKNIRLHPERTKFEYTEALQSLYLVLSTWYDEHGKAYIEDEQETTSEQRYQELGVASQQRLRDLLQRPEYRRLWEGLTDVVSMGRLGSGHLNPTSGEPAGIDAVRTLRSGQGGSGTNREKGTGTNPSPSERIHAPHDRPGDLPTGTTGPRGQHRKLIKGDSEGLWFDHQKLSESSRLWEFDFETGVLTFNTRHGIWEQLEQEKSGRRTKKNDRQLMDLQEWLSLELLVLLISFRTPEELEEHRQALLDTKIRPYVDLCILNHRR